MPPLTRTDCTNNFLLKSELASELKLLFGWFEILASNQLRKAAWGEQLSGIQLLRRIPPWFSCSISPTCFASYTPLLCRDEERNVGIKSPANFTFILSIYKSFLEFRSQSGSPLSQQRIGARSCSLSDLKYFHQYQITCVGGHVKVITCVMDEYTKIPWNHVPT